MNVTIVSKIKKPEPPRNQFKVSADFMIGDADGWSGTVIFFSENEKEKMLEFIEFLHSCLETHQKGGGTKLYKTVKNYNKICETILSDWPREPYTYEMMSLDNFAVTFFDSAGDEYNCVVS